MRVSIPWPKLSRISNSLRNQTDLAALGERDAAFSRNRLSDQIK
jgi:hypothetical protein